MRNLTKLLSSSRSPLSHVRHKSSQTKPRRPESNQPSSNSLYEIISSAVLPEYEPVSNTHQWVSSSTNPKSQEQFTRPPTVCENAQVTETMDKLNRFHEHDVTSAIVQRITEIVRSDRLGRRMEERLEKSGVPCGQEIVAMVLKRCFKVCHLALKFFNWAKSRPGFRHSIETYNTMLYIAGDARHIGLMERLLEEMEKDGYQRDIKTWTILIFHYGKAGRVGKALSAFQAMKKSGYEPDFLVYKRILCALCGAEKPELAMEFYKEMVSKNMALNLELFRMVLNCLVGLGNKDYVQAVIDGMNRATDISEKEAYVCLLRAYCTEGNLRDAQEVFVKMTKKNMVSTEVYEIFVKGLCRAGKMEEALEIINSSITDLGYDFLIDGYLRKGDISKAMGVFATMRKTGHVPAISSYTQTMQHLFRVNNHKDAFMLFDEMLEHGIQPDTVAITALIAGYISVGNISEAWRVLNGVRERNIRVSWKPYNIFIKELCRVSFPQEALKVLKEMVSLGVNPSEGDFNLVIGCLNKMGSLELASEAENLRGILKIGNLDTERVNVSLKNNSARFGVVSSSDDTMVEERSFFYDADVKRICDILYSTGEWGEIENQLERENVVYTPEMVELILKKCTRHGGVALQFFSWVGRKKPNYNHDTCTYNMAIKIAGGAKDFEHMRYLFHEMRRNKCIITSNTWTIMISQYGQAGLTEMALRAFNEMKKEGYQPNNSTYKYLILYLCANKGRKVDEAVHIFQEMLRVGSVPDKETVNTYISCLCEVGKVQNARNCVILLCKMGFEMQIAYSILVNAMCRAGKTDEALILLHEIEKIGCVMDRYMYGSIIHSLLRIGRVEEALNKIEEMKKRGILCTTYVYTSLMVHYFKERYPGKALEMFKKMQEEECELTAVTFSALIRGFMNNGMVKEAWDIFYKMKLKGPYPDFETYSMFMRSLCKVGRSEEALLLIHEMLDAGIVPSAVNFKTVYYGLNREGKCDLARSVLKEKWKLNRQRKYLN